jgi:hypothetical protein
MAIGVAEWGQTVIAHEQEREALPTLRDGAPAEEIAELTNTDDVPLGWEGRVIAVSLVWSLPGTLLGCLACLFLPSDLLVASVIGGGSIGALAGGLLEAGYLD